jgi:glycosyltransferase involved in cell wall biosynthesis
LKIARLVSSFPEDHRISGGLLPNIYHLSKEEIERGHETVIFTSGSAEAGSEYLDGIPIVRAGKPRLSRFFLGEWLLRSLRETGFRPDIIHSMNAMPLGWLYDPKWAKEIGASCVLSVHTPVLMKRPPALNYGYLTNTEYALLLKRLCRRVDFTIAVSRFVRRELVQIGTPRDRIAIAPSGLGIELFPPQEFPFLNPRKTVLYVGRFAKIKALRNLLLAARILRDQEGSAPGFLLVGGTPDDDDYDSVLSSISELDIEDIVTLVPPVEHQSISRIYDSCDCFVLPSNQEPLGKVVLEAMCSFRPVVAARAGGIPDIVWHGKNGLLFESDNPHSLAEEISRMLDSPKEAYKMARRGVSFAGRFDWRKISDMYLQAFNRALEMK